jgi:hypothetical protein
MSYTVVLYCCNVFTFVTNLILTYNGVANWIQLTLMHVFVLLLSSDSPTELMRSLLSIDSMTSLILILSTPAHNSRSLTLKLSDDTYYLGDI